MAPKLFTAEQEAFIRAYYKGRTTQDLVDMVNDIFGLEITFNQMRAYKQNRHLVSGVDTRFKKDQVPWIKGKKFPGCANAGTFKRGRIPASTLPLGAEILRGDGYVWVKLAEPNVWRQKHIHIWEEANGLLPEGHLLKFLDGDRQNVTLDNLALVNRAENLAINRLGLTSDDPELTKTGINVAKLYVATHDKKRR